MEKYGNYYSDGIAELYDLLPLYADRGDAQFYVNYAAASPGPVLELGCGTGRVSIPSAKQGAEILGIDYSASMLRRLRSKLRMESSGVQNRVKVIRGDITQFSLQKKFPLITAPFRSFQHLITQKEQVACLRCAREHLTEGGRIVLDVFQPSPERLFTPSYGPEVDVPELNLPDGRKLMRTYRVVRSMWSEKYNIYEFTYRVTQKDGGIEELVHRSSMCYLFREDIIDRVEESGLKVHEMFGDFDSSALTDQSPELIIVAGT